jgi:hypothetical protein
VATKKIHERSTESKIEAIMEGDMGSSGDDKMITVRMIIDRMSIKERSIRGTSTGMTDVKVGVAVGVTRF